MIVLYQILLIISLIALGYFVFTKYMIKSKLKIIDEELANKKLILSQLIEANSELSAQLLALEKKSKLNQDEILDLYTEIKEGKNDSKKSSLDDRINRLRNSG